MYVYTYISTSFTSSVSHLLCMCVQVCAWIGSLCPRCRETNILAWMQQNEKKVRIRRVMQQELTLSKAISLSSGQRDVPAKNIFRLRMKANFQAHTTT